MDDDVMTWGQFKALVDAKEGVTDETPICYIDVSDCSPRVPPRVAVGETGVIVED